MENQLQIQAVRPGPSECIALVAKDENDTLLGYVIGTFSRNEAKLNRALVPAGTYSLLKRPRLLANKKVLKKILIKLALFFPVAKKKDVLPPPLPDPVMGLFGIGVSSSSRG